jgi:hypothetical protein
VKTKKMFKASEGSTNLAEPLSQNPHTPTPRKTVVMRWAYNSGNTAYATLDTPLERISKLWLTGWTVQNPSISGAIKVSFDPTSTLATQMLHCYATSMNAGGSLMLINQTQAANNSAVPKEQLLATWQMSDGKLKKLGLNLFNGFTDATMTWDYIILIFEAETLEWH